MPPDLLKTTVLGREIRLYVNSSVFTPTLTTSILTDQVDVEHLQGSTVLDLGCGTGPIAIGLALAGARKVFAVDVMEEACQLARRNAELNGVQSKVTVLQGNLFEIVGDQRFDIIVDDVSGVADEVAKLSSWFPTQVPAGGSDGTTHTVRMLHASRRHLTDRGYLLFPVLSLSKSEEIVVAAQSVFGAGLRRVATKRIPFNNALKMNYAALERLRQWGVIGFEQIRSRHFWTLDIYRADARAI